MNKERNLLELSKTIGAVLGVMLGGLIIKTVFSSPGFNKSLPFTITITAITVLITITLLNKKH